MMNIFSKENIGERIKFKIFFVSITVRRNIKFKYLIYKLLNCLSFMLSPKNKLGLLKYFDENTNWQWEIRYKKFTNEEIFKLFGARSRYPKNILSVKDTI